MSGSRKITVTMMLLAVSGIAHGVTKCLSGGEVLYTSASCPAGYKNVTDTMKGRVINAPGGTRNLKAEEAYSALRSQTAEQVRAWRQRDEEENLRAQNALWNQCMILDYRVRATERAMNETEYWSRADRYRQHVNWLRDQQFRLGCFG